ncbi:hypothetical protein, partial [Helicobacter rodentium]
KHFSKKRLIFAILFYFLCSLTIFLLPLDILTKYPYLKYFTDFMDFIPAIKLMETKTYAPELCKFYASYMLVIGVVVLAEVTWQTFIMRFKLSNKLKRERMEKMEKADIHIILYIFYVIISYSMLLFYIHRFLSGKFIGYIPRFDTSRFISNWFEMLWYVDYYQVFGIGATWFFIMLPFMIGNTLAFKIAKIKRSKK